MENDQILRERLQREIDLLVEETIQNEGIMDFLKTAAAGASKVASGAWNKAKATMAQSNVKLQAMIKNKLQQIEQLKSGLAPVVQMIQASEQQAGEKLPPNPGIASAQAMAGLAQEAQAEAQEAQTQAKQQAPAVTPAVPAAQQQQNLQEIASVLAKTSQLAVLHEKKVLKEQTETLTEDLGVTAVIGLLLGLMGGLPMLFKGLGWLAGKLKLPKVQAAMKHAYEVVHHAEAKVIDYIIPDRLSFIIYQGFWKRGLKASKKPLDFASYQAGAENARKTVETYVYKAFLVYFFLNGLAGVLHAGASLLGVAEASATIVKGVELAGAAAEIAGSVAGIGTKA